MCLRVPVWKYELVEVPVKKSGCALEFIEGNVGVFLLIEGSMGVPEPIYGSVGLTKLV